MDRARISNLLRKITVVVVICFFGLPVQAKYGGGTGEPNDPYLIYTAEQMNEIGLSVNWDDLDKCFRLMADIDLSGYSGTAFNIIGNEANPFTGVFDGSGYTISNFIYTSIDTDNIGLFGYVEGVDAEIKNLCLIDPTVDAGTGNNAGSLVGTNGGNITSCYIQGGSVLVDSLGGETGNNVSLLIGKNSGNITNCYVKGGSVSGDNAVGGLVGGNYYYIDPMMERYGTITNCNSTAIISGDFYVGGLVGYNIGTITTSCATSSVSGYFAVGGLVGSNYYTITNCYSTGSASGDSYVGGLVGLNYDTIINSYSSGDVTGTTDIGGLVGTNTGKVIASLWDIESSGQTTSAGGTGRTTAEMQTARSYIGWGCEPVWTINEGVDYPRLVWENTPGELITKPSYGGGSGEPNDPYLIYTAEQLSTIGLIICDLDKHFRLMADIDLAGFNETSFNIIGSYPWLPFTGVFDGNGYTISNFSYNSTDKSCVGLFGYVDDPNAEIKDLGLINVNVAGEDFIGSLAGQLGEGTVTGCYVDGGRVSGFSNVGGLVGMDRGTIYQCYSSCSVSGYDGIGGLVGDNSQDGKITNCYSATIASGNMNVGGLVGRNMSTIINCYSKGMVTGGLYYVYHGGLVGRNMSTIINCYSKGMVIGGLYSVYIGGLVGGNDGGTVSNSFWDIETSRRPSSSGGTGKTTDEMQMQVTFTDAGWDFNTPVWTIDEGNDYPRLWWEFVPVLYAEPDITLGTSNRISWDPVVGAIEYYAECAEDANFTSIVCNSDWVTETSYEFTGLQLGRRYWYSVKARNAEGVESQWSNVESSLQCTLSDAVDIMLNVNNLKSKNLKSTLINKINVVLEMIDEGLYKNALNKLQNDILTKMNGCADTGEPDKNDWIITCEAQSEIYPVIIETIEYIKSLMEQFP